MSKGVELIMQLKRENLEQKLRDKLELDNLVHTYHNSQPPISEIAERLLIQKSQEYLIKYHECFLYSLK